MDKTRSWTLTLQLFADGGGAAAGGGAPAGAAGGDSAGSAESNPGIQAGTTLPDGTRVDERLAERLERQRRRNPGRAQVAAAQGQGTRTQGTPGTAGGTQAGEGLKADGSGNPQNRQGQEPQADPAEAEWQELKKGKYAAQYGRDVQAAVNDRFKNQQDLQSQLDAARNQLNGLNPMLNALMQKTGVKTVEELQRAILDDDSLYEEEAEAAGMTVSAYKTFKALQAENEQRKAREEQEAQEIFYRNHLAQLSQEAEAMKARFPGFDLRTELQNPAFRRMTAPNSGLTVEQAYYAIHHDEIAPQAMAAGVQRAQRQISQSLQANGARPVEGAMTGNSGAPDVSIDPRRMSRAEREQIKERVRRGEKIIL